jgi:hypothetical protein
MRLKNIGYVPYSKELSHPGDRRRVVSWCKSRSIFIETHKPLESDVLVLSNAANFGKWIRLARQPVVIDLVDAYLGERPSFVRDFLRNIVRTINGTSDLRWITYTRHLEWACANSDAVVVASEEQRQLVLPFNKRVKVILDDHSELNLSKNVVGQFEILDKEGSHAYIFWEGFGYTLKHFEHMSNRLDDLIKELNLKMCLLTVQSFPRWGGYIGKVNTQKLIKKMFPKSYSSIEIVPWSVSNLKLYSSKSAFGIIPIDPSDSFAMLKSENKLLSNWTLGIRTLFSATPSYARAGKAAKVTEDMISEFDWVEKIKEIVDRKEFHLQKSATEFLHLNHTTEILHKKWDKVFEEVGVNNLGKL